MAVSRRPVRTMASRKDQPSPCCDSKPAAQSGAGPERPLPGQTPAQREEAVRRSRSEGLLPSHASGGPERERGKAGAERAESAGPAVPRPRPQGEVLVEVPRRCR